MIEPSSFDRTGVLQPQRAADTNHMACDQSQSLSIISVAFSDSGFLEKNLELTKHLNPQLKRRWIVVDNTPRSDLSISAAAGVEILPRVPRFALA
jgi:hypothetical protein